MGINKTKGIINIAFLSPHDIVGRYKESLWVSWGRNQESGVKFVVASPDGIFWDTVEGMLSLDYLLFWREMNLEVPSLQF